MAKEKSARLSCQNSKSDITRVISFTGGKGGVGKTHTVLNIAAALAQMGRSVLLLDADLGLANINVLLGVRPEFNLHHVLQGQKKLAEVIIDGPAGISFIPAASGVESICSLNTAEKILLMEAIEGVAAAYDYLLIDTQAGVGQEVMYFNSASAEIVCVINDQPTSLTDAYALIKILSLNYGEKQISVVANNVPTQEAAKAAFERLARAVDRFLHVDLKYLGWVPADSAVAAAITEQKALLELFPSSPSALALTRVANRLDADFHRFKVKGGMQFFFQQLMELESHGC